MENQNSRSAFSCNCERCGRTLYEGEMLNIRGRFVCEQCAESYIFGAPTRRATRVPSPLFHFIFSLLPGAGHMYLGLMKKGLFQMCLFYFSIYLTATVMPVFFGLTIPIIYAYSFFDSLSLRRRIAAGEVVSDDLNGVTSFMSRNKGLIVLAVIIMLVIGAFSALLGIATFHQYRNVSVGPAASSSAQTVVVEVNEDMAQGIQRSIGNTVTYSVEARRSHANIGPIILIGIGVIIVAKAAKRKRMRAAEDVMDFESKN